MTYAGNPILLQWNVHSSCNCCNFTGVPNDCGIGKKMVQVMHH